MSITLSLPTEVRVKISRSGDTLVGEGSATGAIRYAIEPSCQLCGAKIVYEIDRTGEREYQDTGGHVLLVVKKRVRKKTPPA